MRSHPQMTPRDPLTPRVSRRDAIARMLTAAAAMPTSSLRSPVRPPASNAVNATGYRTDPDLLRVYEPGDVWPLTLTTAQRRTRFHFAI